MSNTPTILGISMAPQKNRRLLVVITYATLVACVIAMLIVSPSKRRAQTAWLLFVPIADLVVSYAVFGQLTKRAVFPPPMVEVTSLGLTPRRRDQDEPDERDLALRNAAHYQAFRGAAVYGFILWASIPLFWHLSGPIVVLLVLLMAMPLLTILLTLPQAIILWTEPDVPEEVRI